MDRDLLNKGPAQFWNVEEKKDKRKGKKVSDPIGSVNIRNSVLHRLHKLREDISPEGKLVPLHEVMGVLVELGEENAIKLKDKFSE